MKGIPRSFWLFLLFEVIFCVHVDAQVVKIMPIGNSITYDYNQADGSNPRPIGVRISYRYKLYQLLTEAGYTFDFVGSEDSGNDYFQNEEMDDNAGFPGITDAGLASLLQTGINPTNGLTVSQGPYLQTYDADIILLHIGTNDLDESPDDVEEILDVIRSYDSDVFIIVARIINRYKHASSLTTLFNDNVEAMIAARGDERIVSVDMEDGAGIDYWYELDDEIHPNIYSYPKMAVVWFNAIENLNSAPVISAVPQQNTAEDTDFSGLSLDNYVSDDEIDAQMNWTFRLQASSHLSAYIDANRVLHVSPNVADWYGSETLRLIVEDSGNGAFRKKDSIDVIYHVDPVNDPPVISSTPGYFTDEDVEYNYILQASDVDDNIADLSYSAVDLPSWLSFNPTTRVLSGIPTNSDLGNNHVVLRVSDNNTSKDQAFDLVVNNVNDAPVITSEPVLSIQENQGYLYELTASDVDVGDVLSFLAITKPDWMNFAVSSTSAMLVGSPAKTDVGTHTVVLHVSDGEAIDSQRFIVTVTPLSATESFSDDANAYAFPNPVLNKLQIKLPSKEISRIEIYSLSGVVQKQIDSRDTDMVEIDVSELVSGIYAYKVLLKNSIINGKFVKNNTY